MKKFRVIFMGTPEFAVPCLAALYEHCDVIGVVTQPDKPRGRGQKLVPSPVKAWAEAHGLPVWQPKKIKEEAFTAFLEEQKPDLMVVVAFGQILSQRILDIPPYGCINVHGSLLPRYRGAAPMQWCVIDGEKKTGITTMFMDAGLDTGDMLLKAEFPIARTRRSRRSMTASWRSAPRCSSRRSRRSRLARSSASRRRASRITRRC